MQLCQIVSEANDCLQKINDWKLICKLYFSLLSVLSCDFFDLWKPIGLTIKDTRTWLPLCKEFYKK